MPAYAASGFSDHSALTLGIIDAIYIILVVVCPHEFLLPKAYLKAKLRKDKGLGLLPVPSVALEIRRSSAARCCEFSFVLCCTHTVAFLFLFFCCGMPR